MCKEESHNSASGINLFTAGEEDPLETNKPLRGVSVQNFQR